MQKGKLNEISDKRMTAEILSKYKIFAEEMKTTLLPAIDE